MKKILFCPQLSISTPFCNYNDAIRNQMAASQCRQAVPLVENEPPIVETTLERNKVLEPDIIYAPFDCVVVFSSTRIILIENKNPSSDNDKYKIFKVSYYYKIPEEKTEFKKGDVISYKIGYFDNNGNLAQGKNLLCSIILHPWCYQDSIVLSDTVNLDSYKYHVIEQHVPATVSLLSLDNKDSYKILPTVGEKIKAFEPILLLKNSSSESIIEDPKPVYISEDSEVIETDLVANVWNHDIREYDIAVLEILQQKDKLAQKIDATIDDEYIKSEIKRYHNLFDYQNLMNYKQSKIVYGKNKFDMYVKIVLRSIDKIREGDKITNRHAAKGVISKITNNDLPIIITKNENRMVDINVDLMSIISRMNIGQIYEIIAGNCIYHMEKRIKEMENLDDAKKFIMGFYEIIDNTEEKWIIEQTKSQLETINSIEEIHDLHLTFPAPPFESSSRQQIIDATIYLNPNIKENMKLYFAQKDLKELPDLSPLLEIVEYNNNKFYATVGYVYFYKLKHMVKEKISARGSGKLTKKTLQPTAGRKNQGGQRFGEMEMWTLLAYDALFNLNEIITLKSDDIQQKLEYIINKLYSYDFSNTTNKDNLEIVKLFKSYLNILRTEIIDD